MTETTHTPGPWRYEESTQTIRAVPANYWLATMDSWGVGAVNNAANARLIAAAPDLLAALEGLILDHEMMGVSMLGDAQARAAIAAARGEASK